MFALWTSPVSATIEALMRGKSPTWLMEEVTVSTRAIVNPFGNGGLLHRVDNLAGGTAYAAQAEPKRITVRDRRDGEASALRD
jgi:hypothetical protein